MYHFSPSVVPQLGEKTSSSSLNAFAQLSRYQSEVGVFTDLTLVLLYVCMT